MLAKHIRSCAPQLRQGIVELVIESSRQVIGVVLIVRQFVPEKVPEPHVVLSNAKHRNQPCFQLALPPFRRRHVIRGGREAEERFLRDRDRLYAWVGRQQLLP